MSQQPLLDVEPAITPEAGWEAQPALTPRDAYLKIVREDVTVLLGVAASLEDSKLIRRPVIREEMRRTLAGVIAHCETLRLALEKGRCG